VGFLTGDRARRRSGRGFMWIVIGLVAVVWMMAAEAPLWAQWLLVLGCGLQQARKRE